MQRKRKIRISEGIGRKTRVSDKLPESTTGARAGNKRHNFDDMLSASENITDSGWSKKSTHNIEIEKKEDEKKKDKGKEKDTTTGINFINTDIEEYNDVPNINTNINTNINIRTAQSSPTYPTFILPLSESTDSTKVRRKRHNFDDMLSASENITDSGWSKKSTHNIEIEKKEDEKKKDKGKEKDTTTRINFINTDIEKYNDVPNINTNINIRTAKSSPTYPTFKLPLSPELNPTLTSANSTLIHPKSKTPGTTPPISSRGAATPPTSSRTPLTEPPTPGTTPPISSRGAATPPTSSRTPLTGPPTPGATPPISSRGAATPPTSSRTPLTGPPTPNRVSRSTPSQTQTLTPSSSIPASPSSPKKESPSTSPRMRISPRGFVEKIANSADSFITKISPQTSTNNVFVEKTPMPKKEIIKLSEEEFSALSQEQFIKLLSKEICKPLAKSYKNNYPRDSGPLFARHFQVAVDCITYAKIPNDYLAEVNTNPIEGDIKIIPDEIEKIEKIINILLESKLPESNLKKIEFLGRGKNPNNTNAIFICPDESKKVIQISEQLEYVSEITALNCFSKIYYTTAVSVQPGNPRELQQDNSIKPLNRNIKTNNQLVVSIMDYFPNGSINQKIEKLHKELKPKEEQEKPYFIKLYQSALKMTVQLFELIYLLEENEIKWSDLKTGNILLDENDNFIIADKKAFFRKKDMPLKIFVDENENQLLNSSITSAFEITRDFTSTSGHNDFKQKVGRVHDYNLHLIGYDELELVLALNGDMKKIEAGKIYLSSENDGYCVFRDPKGETQTLSLKDYHVDLKDLDTRLKDETQNEALKKLILAILSNAGHTYNKPALPENLQDYTNHYFYFLEVDELYYITPDGTSELIPIQDKKRFRERIKDTRKPNRVKMTNTGISYVKLTNLDVYKFITEKDGHIPSALLEVPVDEIREKFAQKMIDEYCYKIGAILYKIFTQIDILTEDQKITNVPVLTHSEKMSEKEIRSSWLHVPVSENVKYDRESLRSSLNAPVSETENATYDPFPNDLFAKDPFTSDIFSTELGQVFAEVIMILCFEDPKKRDLVKVKNGLLKIIDIMSKTFSENASSDNFDLETLREKLIGIMAGLEKLKISKNSNTTPTISTSTTPTISISKTQTISTTTTTTAAAISSARGYHQPRNDRHMTQDQTQGNNYQKK